jgi:hypothetical protein
MSEDRMSPIGDKESKLASIQATENHRVHVCALLLKFVAALQNRGEHHDRSKLEDPELSLFAEWGPKLSQMEYGSEEYKVALDKMWMALRHHYWNNRHHPEHFQNGVDGMDLIDLIEMVIDWKAASLRMKDGDFLGSLETNRERFHLSSQLVRIIANTADFFESSGEPKLSEEYRSKGGLPWGEIAG